VIAFVTGAVADWTQIASDSVAFRMNVRRSRERLVAFQDRRIQEIVSHAYENVPFYRRLFDSNGLHPRHIRGVRDLRLIPVTSKSDLRGADPADLIARGVKPSRLIEHSTGGSTGEPFTVRRSWSEERTLGLLRRRALRDFGVPRGSLVLIATLGHKPHKNDRTWFKGLVEGGGAYRLETMPALVEPEEIHAEIMRRRPRVIGGHASVLTRLAATITERNLPVPPLSMVLSGAEVLTPNASRRMSEAFHAPVFDTYGCHEFGRVAWQCRRTGEYHRCDDGVITEALTGDAAALEGEEGEVVGTALHSRSMPFIRYRLGDIITVGRETCTCGLPFSTLLQVRGRVVDYFRLHGGRLIHPFRIAAALKSEMLDWVSRYQIVQESLDRIVLTAVPTRTPAEETMAGMRRAVHELVGDRVRVDVALVDEIRTDASGKFRVYRSMVT
jgi:phenylacetate-CoA ligase